LKELEVGSFVPKLYTLFSQRSWFGIDGVTEQQVRSRGFANVRRPLELPFATDWLAQMLNSIDPRTSERDEVKSLAKRLASFRIRGIEFFNSPPVGAPCLFTQTLTALYCNIGDFSQFCGESYLKSNFFGTFKGFYCSG